MMKRNEQNILTDIQQSILDSVRSGEVLVFFDRGELRYIHTLYATIAMIQAALTPEELLRFWKNDGIP